MHWLKKQKSQKLVASLILFLFLSVGVFGFVPETHAQAIGVDVGSWLGDWIWGKDSCGPICVGFKMLFYGLLVLFQVFASAALVLFEYVIQPGHIVGLMNLDGVVQLWRFIRDFFNLFFILTLLFSAFATIFQVEQYSLKKLFLNILLGALLVNFSFPITRFLVDMTNVPMYYFANAISPGGTTAGGKDSAYGKILSASQLTELVVPKVTELDKVPFKSLLQGIIFMFIFAISVMVLSVMMFVRVIGLVILVIFSPIGFIASAIPGLQRYGSDWWEKFWKYALFGPAAMLMLLVAVQFMAAVQQSQIMSKPVSAIATGITSEKDEPTALMSMVLFSLPIILIWMAIGTANSFSIAGAGAVTGMGEKFAKWGLKKPWQAAKFVDRKVESKMAGNRVMKYFSPRVWATAIKARSAEQEHKDDAKFKQGAAPVQDHLNSAISRANNSWYGLKFWNLMKPGTDHTNHRFETSQQLASAQEKEITTVSDSGDHVIHESMVAVDNKQLDKLNGALLSLAKTNDLNDWIIRMGKERDKSGNLKYNLQRDENSNAVVSSANARTLMEQVFKEAGEKDDELLAQRVMAISDRATGSGNFAFGGMTRFDETMHGGRGGFRLTKAKGEMITKKRNDGSTYEEALEEDEQATWARGKVKNLESQKRQTSLHPDSLFTRTEEGGFGDLNGEVAEAIIGTFTSADIDQINRSRDDLKEAVFQAYQNQNTQFMELMGNNKIFAQYVQAAVKMKVGDDWKKKDSTADFMTNYSPEKIKEMRTSNAGGNLSGESSSVGGSKSNSEQQRNEAREKADRHRANNPKRVNS